jgi:hypothetical protein
MRSLRCSAPKRVEAMKAQLQPLQEMIDSALGRLGLLG